MPRVGNSRFSRILPLTMFKQLQGLLQQMRSKVGEDAVLLTTDILTQRVITLDAQTPRFTVLVSKQFSALLLGRQTEPAAGDDAKLTLYQVELTFDPEAIASFLPELAHGLESEPIILDLLKKAQYLQPNDAVLQSEFTLLLIEILSTNSISASESASSSSSISVCQPFIENVLYQQVEQERLLHQVTTQIRHSLELPVILKTAVEQVRNFLQVDRLLVYQFDFNSLLSTKQDTLDLGFNPQSSTSSQTEVVGNIISEEFSTYTSELGWGCVTYEAKSSESISSVLNLIEEQGCSTHIPNCRKKYRQGLTFAVDDVEVAYRAYPCLLKMLGRIQVRAKLIAPLVVQNNLWGLLIAQQCFEPRQWKDSEKMFLKQIAEHLTVAIYQAKLYAQLQQQKTTLEERVIERTQALRDTLQAAQSANLAKSEFLAAMSHELRTPLTCVIGMSATLLRWSFGQEGSTSLPLPKQRTYLKTIQESGEHLLELINDILDLSQVEAGKAILNISDFSLSKLIQQTLRALKEKALSQKISLDIDLQIEQQSLDAPTNEDRFCGDQRRVKQILFNLLGNAIKFTPAGGRVILRVWREHNLAIFQIEDTGIGIADDQLPLLFQKFQQLETSYHRTYEGTGLGLALTKQLVELHGGRITVESVFGEGSLFTVWLPSQLLVTATPKVTTTPTYISLAHGSIVLVEDQEEIATSICEILTAASYQIIWLTDASTAVDQIALLQPKAVILGWQLLGMDGSEMMHSLRNSPRTQQIKVLALTTPTLSEDQEHDLNAIADDYLHKPIEPMQLLHKVTALMGN